MNLVKRKFILAFFSFFDDFFDIIINTYEKKKNIRIFVFRGE